MNPFWLPIKESPYPWVRTIEKIINAEELPDLKGDVINVFSDYSGDHDDSLYEVTSVLYLDLPAYAPLERDRRAIRKKYLPDGRRISFKRMSDRKRQQALIPFLGLAHRISGICVTLAVRKTIARLCSDDIMFNRGVERWRFEGSWTAETFERTLRVVNLISLLVGGLSRPHQNIYWISDEDRMFANEKLTRDLKTALEHFTSYYVQHQLGEVGFGTTKIDPGDRYEEDLAAIPDLVSGAVAEIITAVAKTCGGTIPTHGVAVPFSGTFSPKTEVMCDWLGGKSGNLKRPVIVFEQQENGGFAVSRFNFP